MSRVSNALYRASDISRKKKAKFRGIFRGKFRGKIGGFRGIFAARKVKSRRKIGRFRGILAEKSQISKDFMGKFLEKSADLTGNFGGKLRQETISKKQLVFFGKFR